MGAGGMVPMLSPDGQSGDIPMERVNDAMAAGFKRAVVMTAPSGEMGYVPQERAADALKAGFKVGQPAVEKASDVAAAEDPGKAGAFSRGFESVLESAQHMGDEFLPAMNRLLSGANEHNISKAGGMVPFLKSQAAAMSPVAPSRPGGTTGERIAETAGNVVGGMTLGEALPESATKTATEIAKQPFKEVADALPSKVRAGANFQEVMGAAAKMPVDLTNTQDAALRMVDWQKKTQLGPTVNKFLNRITNPKLGPLTYEEARDFYQLLGNLSADETRKIPPAIRRDLTQMVVGLKADVGEAAGKAGKADQYFSAMKEFAQAKRIEDLSDAGKQLLWQMVKYGVPAGAAGLLMKKGIDLATQ